MSPISCLCIIGYAIAAQIIVMATGGEILGQVCATIGALPVGAWCAHCDQMEDT